MASGIFRQHHDEDLFNDSWGRSPYGPTDYKEGSPRHIGRPPYDQRNYTEISS